MGGDMNRTQAHRLSNIAVALRDAATVEKYFDMSNYGLPAGWDFEDCCFPNNFSELDRHTCGTPACALGHYAARTDLQRFVGLDKWGDLYLRANGYGTDHSSNALLGYFGLTGDESFELFGGDGCGNATKAIDAAEYIEEFLKRKGWEVS